MRCEFRTFDDIRALGGNNAADERRFAAAAKLSDVNLALYRTFVQPFLRAAVTPEAAEWMNRCTRCACRTKFFQIRIRSPPR